MIGLNFQTQRMINKLGKMGNRLQIAAADTVNAGAEQLDSDYKDKLRRNQVIKTKFTLNSTKTYKANPIRRSGQPRPLHRINAKVGVRKMKGGKDHYLAELEDGVNRRGHGDTFGRVPVPLVTSRTSKSPQKPVAAANRMTKAKPQTLKAGGRNFGVPGDRRRNGSSWSSRQRFAALYAYQKRGGAGLTGNLQRPFFFIDNKNKLGVFRLMGGRVRKIRDLEKARTRTKASPNFRNAVRGISRDDLRREFIRRARRLARTA
jgi:hypothetical protein